MKRWAVLVVVLLFACLVSDSADAGWRHRRRGRCPTLSVAESTGPRLPQALQAWWESVRGQLNSQIDTIPDSTVEAAYTAARESKVNLPEQFVPANEFKRRLRWFVWHDLEPALAVALQAAPADQRQTLIVRMATLSAPVIRVESHPYFRATFDDRTSTVTFVPEELQSYADLRHTFLHEALHYFVQARLPEVGLSEQYWASEGMTEYLTHVVIERLNWAPRFGVPCYSDEVAVVALLFPVAGDDLWHWYVNGSSPAVPLDGRLLSKLEGIGVDRGSANRVLAACRQKHAALNEYIWPKEPDFLKRDRERLQALGEESQQNAEAADTARSNYANSAAAAERKRLERELELEDILGCQHQHLIGLYQAAGVDVLQQQLHHRTPKAVLDHLCLALQK